MRKLLRGLIFRAALALLLVISGKAHSAQFWCNPEHDKPRVFFMTNDGSTASVLYVEGREPNYWPHQEQVLVPYNADDPLDLRAATWWKVEGRMFQPCRYGIPGWVWKKYHQGVPIPDELSLKGTGIRP